MSRAGDRSGEDYPEPVVRFVEVSDGADRWSRVIDILLEAHTQRAQLLNLIRDKLSRGEDSDALPLIREYCGL